MSNVKKMSRKYQLYVICRIPKPTAPTPATCPHPIPLQYAHSSCHIPPPPPPATSPNPLPQAPTPHPVKLLEITFEIMQKKYYFVYSIFLGIYTAVFWETQDGCPH